MTLIQRMRQRIAIIGAALNQAGFKYVSIFEAASSFAAASKHLSKSGLIIAANGVRVLDQLDLAAHIYKHGEQIQVVNSLSHAGHKLSSYSPPALVHARARSVQLAAGEERGPPLTSIAVHGRHLYDSLASTLPTGVDVHFNAPLHGVEAKEPEEDDSQLVLRAGNAGDIKLDVDLIIGDDGINSKLRREFMSPAARGHGPQELAGVYVRGITPLSALQQLGADKEFGPSSQMGLTEVWGTGCKVAYAFIDPQHVYWLATISNKIASSLLPDASGDPAAMGKALASIFSNCPNHVRALMQGGTADSVDQAPIVELHPASVLHDPETQRMVVVGAAAHSPVQELWQGLAQGMEDAAVLATCLEHSSDRARALEKYSELRIPRASFIGRAAHDECTQALQGGRVMSAFRDMAAGFMPPAVQRDSQTQMLSYDAFTDAAKSV